MLSLCECHYITIYKLNDEAFKNLFPILRYLNLCP